MATRRWFSFLEGRCRCECCQRQRHDRLDGGLANGFTEVVDLLCAQVRTNRTNENGETAVDVALHFKQTDVAAKVRKAGPFREIR